MALGMVQVSFSFSRLVRDFIPKYDGKLLGFTSFFKLPLLPLKVWLTSHFPFANWMIGNLTLFMSSPIFNALLCSMALYKRIGQKKKSFCCLKLPNNGPMVGCVNMWLLISIGNVSPGSTNCFMVGTSTPGAMVVLITKLKSCVLRL